MDLWNTVTMSENIFVLSLEDIMFQIDETESVQYFYRLIFMKINMKPAWFYSDIKDVKSQFVSKIESCLWTID